MSNNRTGVSSIDLCAYRLESCPADQEETDKETHSCHTMRSEIFNSYPKGTIGPETELVSGFGSKSRVDNKIRRDLEQ